MFWDTIVEYIIKEWHAISILEIVAVAFSVTEVLLSYRNNILLYPSGIIACSLSIFLMSRAGLYAESVLSVYYLVMSIYGWHKWTQRIKNADHLPISSCSPRDWRIVAGICIVAFAVLFFALTTFTDSTVPFLDAFVSATAWAGMWLLAKRKIENWVLLNISNIVAIPLLFYKHLPLVALLTTFLFIVAVMGYFRWKKLMEEEQRTILPEGRPRYANINS